MSTNDPEDFTDLLRAWGGGDHSALDRLTQLIYAELHRLAKHYMRGERAGHTLQTTALINEAWLRLVDSSRMQWQNRAHFLAVAARIMRRVLVDFAREHNYQKRGGGAAKVELDKVIIATHNSLDEIVAIHEALAKMEQFHPREAEVIEMSFFGGLEGKEIAEALGVSPPTVSKNLKFAKLWLRRELSGQA
ncbi:MAG: sigma-70 family RNA polymerase sigma factor [Acidobacteria bacterium]|nr:sigma-70 family RNA polymerase sigma factor [Acidobacteriota bacterium]